jgi:hypothetical protein
VSSGYFHLEAAWTSGDFDDSQYMSPLSLLQLRTDALTSCTAGGIVGSGLEGCGGGEKPPAC